MTSWRGGVVTVSRVTTVVVAHRLEHSVLIRHSQQQTASDLAAAFSPRRLVCFSGCRTLFATFRIHPFNSSPTLSFNDSSHLFISNALHFLRFTSTSFAHFILRYATDVVVPSVFDSMLSYTFTCVFCVLFSHFGIEEKNV